MISSSPIRYLVAAALLALLTLPRLAHADEPATVTSIKSGPWSAADTWDAGRGAPKAGDRVLIREGHHVMYDVASAEVIRMVQIAGALEFVRDRDTKLEVGLVKIAADENLSEEGFDCHMAPEAPAPGKERPALLVGTPDEPILAGKHATIRLHYIEGMDAESCPAIVCCGGRMEFHGAPLAHTWVKLEHTASVGSRRLALSEAVRDWKDGDRVIITSTRRRQNGFGFPGGDRDATDGAQTEERLIVAPERRGFGGGPPGGGFGLERMASAPLGGAQGGLSIDKPLEFEHYASGDYRGEVANLSRNVVVESADPKGTRGHTMYHAYSTGSVSYAEFRHLGKRDKLGRYSLHFHLAGETMRGSYVIGASIWDSDNRWLTIHGTNYLLVRDCVGYRSVGHGFFLEDATEVYNSLDHNLAVMAMAGKPLPKQVIPFDENRGAGFWFANCQNSFTNNVTVDCDEYGYRFENKKTADFDPVLPIMQPDGTHKPRDTRNLPFIQFANNESHSQNHFALNLRGLSRPKQGLDFYSLNGELTKEATEAIPDQRYPFWVHNFRAWETEWAFHTGSSGVFLDGLDVFRCDYGIWRSVIDRHTYRNLSFKEIGNKDLHMPFSVGVPDSGSEQDKQYFRGIPGFVDDLPPTTIITRVTREGDQIVVRGVTTDSGAVKRVTVNGRKAYSTSDNFSDWEASFDAPSGQTLQIAAQAEDAAGNKEMLPHSVAFTVPKIASSVAEK